MDEGRSGGTVLFAALLCALGCGDDTTESVEKLSSQDAPMYVFTNEVLGDEDSTTYINALRSLDDVKLDLKRALEYPGGRATVVANEGKLYVAPPTSPLIESFEIHDDGSFHKTGEVSFLGHGIDEVSLDDWGVTFISATKAYVFNSSDGSAIIWNPESMEIVGEVDLGDADFVREDMEIQSTSAVVRGDRMFRAISWNNWDTGEFSREQYLVVYDLAQDRVRALVPEQRCPTLSNRVDSDEDGNLYFSNWIWNVGATLVDDAPSSCVLRIKPGEERFDPGWKLAYGDLAGGREGAMFAYLGAGKALFSAFHAERTKIDAKTVGFDLVSEPHWRLWLGDLDEERAAPLEGLGDATWNTGAISTYHIDEHDFVLVPGEDWATTTVYEVADERARKKFTSTGWSYQFFRLR